MLPSIARPGLLEGTVRANILDGKTTALFSLFNLQIVAQVGDFAAITSLCCVTYVQNFGRYTPAEKDKTLRICHCDIKNDNLLINFDGMAQNSDTRPHLTIAGPQRWRS